MSKHLTLAEIDGQTAVELPERHLLAAAIATRGLVNAAVAIDNVNVEVLNNSLNNNNVEVCVGVAAVQAAVGCQQ